MHIKTLIVNTFAQNAVMKLMAAGRKLLRTNTFYYNNEHKQLLFVPISLKNENSKKVDISRV